MVEEQRLRIDEAMTKLLEDVDKSYIRVLQGKMFKCAASCCDDQNSSMRNVQKCIENCARPLENAQSYVKNECNHFQDRLQRCVMSCNDTIRDKITPDTKEAEISKYTREFENCATKCVDLHINIIPDMRKKIKNALKEEMH